MVYNKRKIKKGENLMDAGKIKRIEIFEDTMKQISQHDALTNSCEFSKKNTRIYKEDEVLDLPSNPNKQGIVKVVNERSFKASQGYDNVAVLNFASATNPGGGVKTGSNAQEECLCRCSTLYPCLTQEYLFKDFYKYHRSKHDTMYTDRIIYTKEVTVFKADVREPFTLIDNDWYNVDVITSAAPNIREVKNVNQNELLKIFKSRIERIFQVAIVNGNTNIVVGAFGCGAFKNPPTLVARAFNEVLKTYRGYFDNIIFATLVTPNQGGDENFKVFSRMVK
jgi:uncharacterized protein (TIGR02452 family)